MNKIYKSVPRFVYWMVPMYSYGFYRGIQSEYKPPMDLMTHKIMYSTINGVYYTSPWGILKLCHLMNRIEISMFKKNSHKDYPSSYEELFSINKNVF
jgi:hypothetical protein